MDSSNNLAYGGGWGLYFSASMPIEYFPIIGYYSQATNQVAWQVSVNNDQTAESVAFTIDEKQIIVAT